MTNAVTGWVDCSAGVSGDMLLAALVDAGADITAALAQLPLDVDVRFEPATRGALRGVQAHVVTGREQPLRRPADIERIVIGAALPAPVTERALAVLRRLAEAESRVHGIDVSDVHFHEIGAVDTVVDVVGVCAGVHQLGITSLIASPIELGNGTAATEHGDVPLPGPAVLELLRSSSLVAGGGATAEERATPTGVALLAELATGSGPMPAMRVTGVGIGAGGRDDPSRPNVVRLVVGARLADDEEWTLLEANVDDLDPRLWPEVIDRLLVAGAADAWVAPIMMKKGRPAHTLSALAAADRASDVRSAMFRESSTIGVRTTSVAKTALDRDWVTVDVDGAPVRVKIARLDGDVVNATPEWDDVVTAARTLDRPAKAVLAAAAAAAQQVKH